MAFKLQIASNNFTTRGLFVKLSRVGTFCTGTICHKTLSVPSDVSPSTPSLLLLDCFYELVVSTITLFRVPFNVSRSKYSESMFDFLSSLVKVFILKAVYGRYIVYGDYLSWDFIILAVKCFTVNPQLFIFRLFFLLHTFSVKESKKSKYSSPRSDWLRRSGFLTGVELALLPVLIVVVETFLELI